MNLQCHALLYAQKAYCCQYPEPLFTPPVLPVRYCFTIFSIPKVGYSHSYAANGIVRCMNPARAFVASRSIALGPGAYRGFPIVRYETPIRLTAYRTRIMPVYLHPFCNYSVNHWPTSRLTSATLAAHHLRQLAFAAGVTGPLTMRTITVGCVFVLFTDSSLIQHA